MARDRVQPGAAIFRRTQTGVPITTLANDGGNGAERFHVVDHRGTAVEADHGREGRPDSRIAALAFQRLHERRFLTALVGARAGVGDKVKIKAAALDVFAEVALGVGFGDRRVHDVDNVAIFAAYIDVALVRADRAAGDDHAFDQLVRVHFHQRTILAGSRFAFIGVRQDIFRLGGVFGNETPLQSGGKARAATPAEVRLLHFVDDLIRRHLQGFFKAPVTFVLAIDLQFVRARDPEPLADHQHLSRQSFVHGSGGDGRGLGLFAVLYLLENT